MVHVRNTVTGVIVRRRSTLRRGLWPWLHFQILHQMINSVPTIRLPVKSAGDISHNSRGKIAPRTNSPTWVTRDRNTVEQLELNDCLSPKKQTLDAPTYISAAPWPVDPPISPLSSGKPSPPILIKVKEAFQKCSWWGLTWGPPSRLSVDASIQKKLGLHRPGDSRFGVSVYPPLGQSVHTLTPACQRRDQQDITRERERAGARSRGRRFSRFLNKEQTPAGSNKTVQLLSLLTRANLSSAHEAWLVNMNCNSLIVDCVCWGQRWGCTASWWRLCELQADVQGVKDAVIRHTQMSPQSW